MNTAGLKWNTGDYVVYKKRGVYQVSEIRTEKVAGDVTNYYILRSVYDPNATVYVPADKPLLVAQMENILSSCEVDDIIRSAKNNPMEWISVNSERFRRTDEIMAQGSLCEILAMMLLLMDKKQEALSTKTKFFAHDERTLNASRKVISEAFSFPLDVDRKLVVDYIAGIN